ncbi:aromatic acid exporter family protein [Streptomyces sp. NPDC056773]|uniref:aromatic acid exporter family protein n=1 Tax=unclassified Streptomyces TaxID=2593676 RepID=UPI00367AEC62
MRAQAAARVRYVSARWRHRGESVAPFTALVALQATGYRSARDCAQYLLAMAAGALLAATLAATVGIHGWSFGLLTLLGLWAGRVRRLGQQGAQVAIVGFFAFSSGHGRIDYVGYLTAAVAIGALCGLGAQFVLAPARHSGHRRQAVARLCTDMSRRITALADNLEASEPDGASARGSGVGISMTRAVDHARPGHRRDRQAPRLLPYRIRVRPADGRSGDGGGGRGGPHGHGPSRVLDR